MEIRQLNPSDVKEYFNIRLISLKNNPESFAASYEEEKLKPLEIYSQRLESIEFSITFGAFKGTELIGIVTVVRETKMKLNHRSTIVSMYVKQEYRGHGTGKSLLNEAIQHARRVYQSEQLHLTVASINHAAKSLYESKGFNRFGTEEKALKLENKYIDIDHMVLNLE